MLVLRDRDEDSDRTLSMPLRCVGAGRRFASEGLSIASRECVEFMRKRGLIVWVNAIVYEDRAVLAARQNDDGWSRPLDRGI